MKPADEGADFRRLTAVVTSSGDPKALSRLLKSLSRYCPGAPVLVSSPEPVKMPKGVTLVQKLGGGVSGARNALLSRLRTPLFLLLEDHTQLHAESEVAILARPVESGELDIAAGDVTACRKRWFFTKRRPMPSHGTFELTSQELVLRRGYREANDRFHMCDVVPNFFVARTDKVRLLGGWDEALPTNEREEFFLRAFRQGLRVGFCPAANVWKWHPSGKDERPELRNYAELAVERMGLERMVGFDGVVYSSNALVKRAA